MAQDTNIENLIINKLTKAQYESIANPDPAQLYFITDEVISSSDVVNALGYTPENVANKTTTLSSSSTDTQYPSAKAVYDQIANIDTLPSQTGQSGKFLTTDGTDASWGNLPIATASTVGVVKPDNASIKVDNDGTISAICRNVGEIISSTLPLTDAGLHLLDGSLLQYGIYKEFIDYIADLYAKNPSANYFTTEALWQKSVTTYGSCGKFVYNATDNTVRLPKVSDILQGTTDVSALGDLIEAGLPNISANTTMVISNINYPASGAFSWSGTQRKRNTDEGGSFWQEGSMSFSASRSSSLYKNNFNKVQPQTIKVLYYIVIANSTKTDIQVDIDKIATDLNGKADTDLTNTTDNAKVLMSSMAMPSDKHIDLTLGASGTTYTAPANGFIQLRMVATSNLNCGFSVYNTTMALGINFEVFQANAHTGGFIPVKKGDVFSVSYWNSNVELFRFIYAVGSESEAQ